MRFVHSYWTKPALLKRWGIDQIISNIWYYSLSMTYVKKLNQTIVLYTDDFGKFCLDHLPYDEIHTTLNNIPKNIKPFVWAYGKFMAMKDEPLGSIHIDGDVFIKNNICLSNIKKPGYDLVVQCHEKGISCLQGIYHSNTEHIAHMKYPEWGIMEGRNAYNTGLVRFNNQEQKDMFLNNYFKMAYEISNDDKCIASISNDIYGCPDLIIEQQFMYDSARYYKVNCLLEWEKLKESANRIGYQHVIGTNKYKPDNVEKCKILLKQKDIKIFENTLKKVKEVERFLNEKGAH